MGIGAINNAFTLFSRIIDSKQPIEPLYADTSNKPAAVLSPIRNPFPRCRPEDVGIPSAAVRGFLTELAEDETMNMHCIQIIRNGKMLAEVPFGDYDPRCWKQTFSACKSITSLAIGFLYDEGKIHPDEKLIDCFPGKIPAFSRARELTVRHLLTMTTGSTFNEGAILLERDWRKGYFSSIFTPDTFSYNSLNTYMLSVLVEERSGMPMSHYLTPRLFAPLAIDSFYWEKCPMGIEKGGWGLYIRPEDLAKIGTLVLQDGVWKDRQLLSREWIRAATSTQVSSGNISSMFDYGYQFWTGRNSDTFLMNGMLGQNVFGFRSNGIILLSHAGNDELFHAGNYFPLAQKYFGGEFSESLPENTLEYNRLLDVSAALRSPLPTTAHETRKTFFSLFRRQPAPAALPSECDRLHQTRYVLPKDMTTSVGLMPVTLQMIQNNYSSAFRSVSFRRNADNFFMQYEENDETHLIRIGFTHPAESTVSFRGVPYLIRTIGKFTEDEDGNPLLKLRISFLETPMTRVLKIYYAGNHPHIRQTELPGSDFIFSKVIDIKNDLTAAPLIGSTVNKVDNDYLRYRIEKVFAPDLPMTIDNESK